MNLEHPGGRRRALAVLALAGVLLLQLYSRYGAAPVTDFTVDDWRFLQDSALFKGYGEIWSSSIRDIFRPIHLSMLLTTFRYLGDQPVRFFILGAVAYSVLLATCMGLVFALTRRFRACLLFGVAFALWFTLTESFHFWSHVALTYLHISYVGCALCWVLYLQRRSQCLLAASVALYGIGLGSYEFGIGLPLVFMILMTGQPPARRVWAVTPFLAVALLFLSWRFTHGFGLGRYLLCGPEFFRVDLSVPALKWNVRQVLSWWAGGKAVLTLRNGLDAFATLPIQVRFLHVAVSAVIGVLIYFSARPARNDDNGSASAIGPFGIGQVVLFGLLWAALGQAPNLLTTASARHLLFPLIGLLIAASAVLDRVWNRKFAMLLALAAPMCLIVNQGTSADWREAGRFNRRLYEHVQKTVGEWRTKDLAVFDTRSIRQHPGGGRAEPGFSDPQRWAFHGNAHLLRGFAVEAMIRLAQKGGPPPVVLLDTEYGARAEGNKLLWHERYDPGKPHVTPLDRVYVIDCFEIAQPDREDRR